MSAIPQEAFAPGTPRTMIGAFVAIACRKGPAPAARQKVGGEWRRTSWEELASRAAVLSDGLVALGLQPGERVAIIGPTRLPWVLADLAVMGARGVVVTIYHSNTPAECAFIVQDSGAAVVFAGDRSQLEKFLSVRAQIPSVRNIVLLEGEPLEAERPFVMSLDELAALGREKPPAQRFEARAALVREDDLNCLIYTSGTTGNPKGVMLTHGNWAYTGGTTVTLGLMLPDDTILNFLPLAHSFARVGEMAWFASGLEMIFCDVLEKIVDYAGETRPTIVPAVPRVFEKAYNAIVNRALETPGLRGKLIRWAFAEFEAYAAAREAGQPSPLSFTAAKLVFRRRVAPALKERFGGRVRFFICGGAPLPRKVAYFFDMLGLPIYEGYGLTETAAPSNVNRPGRFCIGTVGPSLPGTEIKIAEDGEILIRGPGVMKGYWNNPAATAEALLPDGWFKTGDIGVLDPDGFLRITDRKKDIIVTSGGKNVAPQNIENALKADPIISQVVVHGDGRKFLSALITVSEEAARKVLLEEGGASMSYAELSRHPKVQALVRAVVERVNKNLASFETIKKFFILPEELSQATGELTPTLKVKRRVCEKKYKDILDGFYREE